MSHRVPRWPAERRLGLLLQTPAHRVVRVLQVTQAQWVAAEALASAHPMPTSARRSAPAREEALAA